MGDRYGRYETLRTIASGGMATVYLGRAVGEGGFERLVAIKVMHQHIAQDPDFRAMFLDEARLAARIRHPNVVGTLDVAKSDEGMFLVMDFVDGPSLHNLRREFRRRKESIPVAITLRIFIDALTGLHAAHELTGPDGAKLNLVHRDVSPQNILVGKDGVTRITDFGVARAEARITSTRGGQLKGKLAYMPSEQVRNEPVDRRTDVYAAGVALWEALAGKRLFRADNEAGLIHMILEGAMEPPTRFNEEVPDEVVDVCMRALSVEREDRFDTAADFADALEEAAQAAGVSLATARKVAKFIEALPPRLSEKPAPMTTTPSSLSLADLAKAEITKLDGEDTLADPDEVDTRMVDSEVSAARAPSNSVTTASAVVASQAVPVSGKSNLRMFAAGAVLASLLAGGVFALTKPAPADGDEPTPAATQAPPSAAPEAADGEPSASITSASSAPTPSTSTVAPPPEIPPSSEPVAPQSGAGPKAIAPKPTAPKTTVPKTVPKHTGPGYKPKEL